MRLPERQRGHSFPYGMMRPGQLYSWASIYSSFVWGNVPVLQRFYAYPIRVPHPIHIDQFIISLFSGIAGGLARVGLYEQKHDGTIFPGKLIIEGQIDCSSSGAKPLAISPAKRLPPAIYWLAVIWNNTSIQPYATFSANTFFGTHGIENYGGGGNTEFINGVYADGVIFGSLPDPFPALTGWLSHNSSNTAYGWVISFKLTDDPDMVVLPGGVTFTLTPSSALIVGPQGYVAGGTGSSTEMDNFQFASETTREISAVLVTGRQDLGGGNSSTRGYFMGGGTVSNNKNEIDGIQFSDETAINPSAALALARRQLACVNSSSRQYAGGGTYESGSTLNSAEIDGIRFDTEAAINPTAALATARGYLGSYGSSTKGYWHGGCSYNYTNYNEIDGIQYSDETAVNPAATLTNARRGISGHNSSTKGYCGGGYSTGIDNDIDGLLFSNETLVDPATTLVASRMQMSAVNSDVKGYWIGGYNGSSGMGEIDGIQFSDETQVNPSATLYTTRYGHAGCQSGGYL
jgi:hypothetical protein